MQYLVRTWIVLALFGLAGCAAIPAKVVPPPPALNRAPIAAFEIDGRMAVHYRRDASTVTLHWRHLPSSDRVTFSSPLGQTVAVLTRDEHGVILVDSQQHTHSAQSVEDLTERLLGWRLPLGDLTYWVVGAAVPNQTYQLQSATKTGEMRLDQSGWTVIYKRWTAVGAQDLPTNLTLTGYDAAVHLVISDWHLTAIK